MFIFGDWGLGIGDWGLGIGDRAEYSTSNPPLPITNHHINVVYI